MNKTDLLKRYHGHLTFRNYRPNTVEAYTRCIEKFLTYCQERRDLHLDKSKYAISYLTHLFSLGRSWSTVNIHYSAIKLLFIHILEEEWEHELLPRPRGHTALPTILSGRQVESIINGISNMKHKTIVTLLYSAGIRISELINIDVSHLLLERAQLKVVMGKGGKDRLVALPPTTIKILEVYLQQYKPQQILFEGYPANHRYSNSSVRKIINRVCHQVGIIFKVSPHSFRYAYATHHIENGTNLVTLQHQLGHRQPSTTIKYIKLCKSIRRRMNHPIERLNIRLK